MQDAGSTVLKPFITLHHITRRFGPVPANQDVSLELYRGEIHAIVGENGAGKSTLMKILNGELRPDEGEIRINGRPVAFRRPQEAILAGIGMTHQQFLIFPHLTALENIIVGNEPGAWGWIRRNAARRELLELCRSVGFSLPMDAQAATLSFAHRQQIEILRLLYRKVKVLIFDEPTSLLAPPETERFLALLRTLQASGHTILFISHRLQEVLAIADRISVLSRGRCAGTFPASAVGVEQLVQLVVSGGKISSPEKDEAFRDPFHPPDPQSAIPRRTSLPPLLELSDVTTAPGSEEASLDRFSLEVHQGEIVGLGGVVGNGQRTLALLLFGILPVARGTVVYGGREITGVSISERIAMGICWLPADPLEEALLSSRPLWENLLLGYHRQPVFQRWGWLRRRFIKQWAKDRLDRNGIVYASPEDFLSGLSGGNAQKVALCRTLEDAPRLVILEQPSRGLDIQAQEKLRTRVREMNQGGTAFLIMSYDLDELLGLSHRLGVLYRGRLMGLVTTAEATREQLGRWMLGITDHDHRSGHIA